LGKLSLVVVVVAPVLALTSCRAFEPERSPDPPSSDAGVDLDSGLGAPASGFCARNADAMECRDFDDGEHRLAVSASTLDAKGRLVVLPDDNAPSRPNIVRALGPGG
jgi:hypothetical protein